MEERNDASAGTTHVEHEATRTNETNFFVSIWMSLRDPAELAWFDSVRVERLGSASLKKLWLNCIERFVVHSADLDLAKSMIVR